MSVICSWCVAEGSPADVPEEDPLEAPEEVYMVCSGHQVMLGAPDRHGAEARRATSCHVHSHGAGG
jgi:hypothetical protein